MIQPSTIYNETINQQIIQLPYLRSDVVLLLEMYKKEQELKQYPLTTEEVF
jgi:hypothetical protein